MSGVEIALDVVMLAVCVAAAVVDLRQRRIPDWLTLPALGVGLLARAVAFGPGGVFDSGLVSALSGALVCGAVFGLFWAWGGGLGGGDVKLMAAVGGLAGFSQALACAMAAALFGAALALVAILWRRRVGDTARHFLRNLFTRPRPDGPPRLTIPYALAIALGVCWAVLLKYGAFGAQATGGSLFP